MLGKALREFLRCSVNIYLSDICNQFWVVNNSASGS